MSFCRAADHGGSEPKLWVEHLDLSGPGGGVRITASHVEGHRVNDGHIGGQRIERPRALALGDPLFGTSREGEKEPVLGSREGPGRIELDGPEERLFGTRRVPVVLPLDGGQRRVSIGK